MSVRVKFWGVRGSIACSSPNHVVYGGNTSCIEVTMAKDDGEDIRLILDAGTGLRALGRDYMKRAGQREAILLLTHTHWDHVNGFPFFTPAYVPGWRFRILAGHLSESGGIHSVLAAQMSNPMFPVPLGAMQAEISFEDFKAGESLTDLCPGLVVKTRPLRHPNGATGYRLELGAKVVSYITDTEHLPGEPDENVLALMQDADLAIYDSMYTDDEFPAKKGWGHSTWQEGVRLARQAGVKQLAIFHHDPEHEDDFMEQVEDEARRMWPCALVARDNMVISL